MIRFAWKAATPRFFLLSLAAYVRGWFWRWPRMPWSAIPQGYTAVSCGFATLAECRAMFAHGWEPVSFQRAPGHGWARLFRVHHDLCWTAADAGRWLAEYCDAGEYDVDREHEGAGP